MKSGPPKKPTVLRLAEGNLGRRPIPRNEPAAPVAPKNIAAPRYLNKAGKAIWKEMVPVLTEMGVFTQIDQRAFARYCDMYAKWLKVRDYLDAKGEVYPIMTAGRAATEFAPAEPPVVKCLVQLPQVAIYRNLSAALIRLEQEFGLTPAARTRIQVDAVRMLQPSERNGDDFEYGVKGRA